MLAEETLREKGGSLSAKALYQIVLQATGDKKEAEKARRKRWLEEMKAGEVPEV